MIIGKVHHRLRFLTISLSYGLSPASLRGRRASVSQARGFSRAPLPLRACRSSCLGQELRGEDSHSVQQSGESIDPRAFGRHRLITAGCAADAKILHINFKARLPGKLDSSLMI